jgi:hypothetical protein
LSADEKEKIEDRKLQVKDRTLVAKVHCPAGEIVELITATKNQDSKRGINSFERGQISQINDGGTIVVDYVKFGHAIGVIADSPATKQFTQTAIPADLENSIVVISQGGHPVAEIPFAEFAFKGDEPQTRTDQWLGLTEPIILVGGKSTKIELMRPEGVTGAEAFVSVELKGLQTLPRRTA